MSTRTTLFYLSRRILSREIHVYREFNDRIYLDVSRSGYAEHPLPLVPAFVVRRFRDRAARRRT